MSLLFIGQGRVGKTSLKKSLLGEASKKKEPSTIGIEFDVVEVQENDKSNPWKRAKDDQFMASKTYTDNVLGKEVARTIAEGKNEPEEGRGGSAAGDEDYGVELEGESGDPSETKNGSEEGADDEVGQGDKDRARAGDEDGAGVIERELDMEMTAVATYLDVERLIKGEVTRRQDKKTRKTRKNLFTLNTYMYINCNPFAIIL